MLNNILWCAWIGPWNYRFKNLFFYNGAVCIMYCMSLCGILMHVWCEVHIVYHTMFTNVALCGANMAPRCTTGGDTLVPETPGGLSVTICQRGVSLRCKGRHLQKKRKKRFLSSIVQISWTPDSGNLVLVFRRNKIRVSAYYRWWLLW